MNKKLATAFLLLQKPVPDPEVLSEFSAQLISELSDQQIDAALHRVVRECEWITPKAVFERAPKWGERDGRPDPETAWAMCPKSDEKSVVWTAEMAEAFDVARSLLNDGDSIAARMAFKENYSQMVAKARLERRPIEWKVSLGWDKAGRVMVLSEAVHKNQISSRHAFGLLGPEQQDEFLQSLPSPERLQLTGDTKPNTAQLTGLPMILAELSEQKLIPEIKVTPKPERKERTPEEVRQLREKAKRDLEILQSGKTELIESIAAQRREAVKADF